MCDNLIVYPTCHIWKGNIKKEIPNYDMTIVSLVHGKALVVLECTHRGITYVTFRVWLEL